MSLHIHKFNVHKTEKHFNVTLDDFDKVFRIRKEQDLLVEYDLNPSTEGPAPKTPTEYYLFTVSKQHLPTPDKGKIRYRFTLWNLNGPTYVDVEVVISHGQQ